MTFIIISTIFEHTLIKIRANRHHYQHHCYYITLQYLAILIMKSNVM